MANIFSTEQLSAISEFYDDMFDTFKKQCRLIYPPKRTACTSCILPIDNIYTQGTGETGGPIFGSNVGGCPVCGGSQFIETEYGENIYVIIDWSPQIKTSKFNTDIIAKNILLEHGFITIQGYIADMRKVKRCVVLKMQLPLNAVDEGQYRLVGSPADSFNILQGKFFLATLERVG